jgi:pilus assembly protein CpaB
MSWKTWVPVVMALVMGLVAAKTARDMMRRARVASKVEVPTTKVVVAARDVAAGAELSAEDLALGEVPGKMVPAGTASDPQALVGRVAVANMVAGQTVLETLLAPAETGAGLQALVPRGMRALTIEINEMSGVAGHLTPGSRVDVIATLTGQDSRRDVVTRTVAQAVPVTAVGQRAAKPGASGQAQAAETPQVTRSVTLLVTPQQAELIQLVSSAARCTLALRGSKDREGFESEGVSLSQLRGDVEAEKPVTVTPTTVPVVQFPPAVQGSEKMKKPRTRSVEVIIGGQVRRVELSLGESNEEQGGEPVAGVERD